MGLSARRGLSPMDRTSDVELADALGALSSTTRLALLRALRTPTMLADIRVRGGGTGDESSGPIARQTVSKHLAQLVDAGLVGRRELLTERGATVEFFLNHQAFYALAEELRDLARLRPAVEPSEATVQRASAAQRPLGRAETHAPRLVVVKGLDDGTSFDLTPHPPDVVEWAIGRRRGLAVSLDFDPFVSAENTVIRWSASSGHVVIALPGSRNGTLLNFEPIAPGEPNALRHGDLVSVGRSTLCYWEPKG